MFMCSCVLTMQCRGNHAIRLLTNCDVMEMKSRGKPNVGNTESRRWKTSHLTALTHNSNGADVRQVCVDWTGAQSRVCFPPMNDALWCLIFHYRRCIAFNHRGPAPPLGGPPPATAHLMTICLLIGCVELTYCFSISCGSLSAVI